MRRFLVVQNSRTMFSCFSSWSNVTATDKKHNYIWTSFNRRCICSNSDELTSTRASSYKTSVLKVLWVWKSTHLVGRRSDPSTTETRWTSSAKYFGSWPDSAWRTTQAILNWTCQWTGSQCSWCNTGVRRTHSLRCYQIILLGDGAPVYKQPGGR